MPKIAENLTNTKIKEWKIPDVKPRIEAVGGVKGLEVVKYHISGTTTFRLRVYDLEGIKHYLKVGDFEIKGSTKNLTVEQARKKAEIDAEEYQQSLIAPVVSASNPTAVTPDSLFSDVVKAWQAWYVTYHENPNALTLEAHRSNLDCHLLPEFGNLKFHEVNRQRCLIYLTELRASTKQGATADKSRQILNAIFDWAVTDNNIPNSVMVSLKRIASSSLKCNA